MDTIFTPDAPRDHNSTDSFGFLTGSIGGDLAAKVRDRFLGLIEAIPTFAAMKKSMS